MKTLKKPILAILAAAVLSAVATAPANATGLIAGATFPQQIISELTRIEQYVTQAEQLSAQYQMVYNQAKNLQSLPVQMLPDASAALSNLVNLVGNAQGLNYATQNSVAALQSEFGDPTGQLNGVTQNLQQWTKNLNGQTSGALKQFGLQAANIPTTQAAMQTFLGQSENAAGRLEALKAGNQMTNQLVGQLQSLQATIITAHQVQMNDMAMKAAEKVQSDNAEKAWNNAPPIPGLF